MTFHKVINIVLPNLYYLNTIKLLIVTIHAPINSFDDIGIRSDVKHLVADEANY